MDQLLNSCTEYLQHAMVDFIEDKFIGGVLSINGVISIQVKDTLFPLVIHLHKSVEHGIDKLGNSTDIQPLVKRFSFLNQDLVDDVIVGCPNGGKYAEPSGGYSVNVGKQQRVCDQLRESEALISFDSPVKDELTSLNHNQDSRAEACHAAKLRAFSPDIHQVSDDIVIEHSLSPQLPPVLEGCTAQASTIEKHSASDEKETAVTSTTSSVAHDAGPDGPKLLYSWQTSPESLPASETDRNKVHADTADRETEDVTVPFPEDLLKSVSSICDSRDSPERRLDLVGEGAMQDKKLLYSWRNGIASEDLSADSSAEGQHLLYSWQSEPATIPFPSEGNAAPVTMEENVNISGNNVQQSSLTNSGTSATLTEANTSGPSFFENLADTFAENLRHPGKFPLSEVDTSKPQQESISAFAPAAASYQHTSVVSSKATATAAAVTSSSCPLPPVQRKPSAQHSQHSSQRSSPSLEEVEFASTISSSAESPSPVVMRTPAEMAQTTGGSHGVAGGSLWDGKGVWGVAKQPAAAMDEVLKGIQSTYKCTRCGSWFRRQADYERHQCRSSVNFLSRSVTMPLSAHDVSPSVTAGSGQSGLSTSFGYPSTSSLAVCSANTMLSAYQETLGSLRASTAHAESLPVTPATFTQSQQSSPAAFAQSQQTAPGSIAQSQQAVLGSFIQSPEAVRGRLSQPHQDAVRSFSQSQQNAPGPFVQLQQAAPGSFTQSQEAAAGPMYQSQQGSASSVTAPSSSSYTLSHESPSFVPGRLAGLSGQRGQLSREQSPPLALTSWPPATLQDTVNAAAAGNGTAQPGSYAASKLQPSATGFAAGRTPYKIELRICGYCEEYIKAHEDLILDVVRVHELSCSKRPRP